MARVPIPVMNERKIWTYRYIRKTLKQLHRFVVLVSNLSFTLTSTLVSTVSTVSNIHFYLFPRISETDASTRGLYLIFYKRKKDLYEEKLKCLIIYALVQCTVLVHVNHFRRGGKFAFLTVGGVGGGEDDF